MPGELADRSCAQPTHGDGVEVDEAAVLVDAYRVRAVVDDLSESAQVEVSMAVRGIRFGDVAGMDGVGAGVIGTDESFVVPHQRTPNTELCITVPRHPTLRSSGPFDLLLTLSYACQKFAHDGEPRAWLGLLYPIVQRVCVTKSTSAGDEANLRVRNLFANSPSAGWVAIAIPT